MSLHFKGMINHLVEILPEGLLVDASWLESQGYYRSLRSKYVSSGWLEKPVRGVFRRPRGSLTWEQVVISMQTLLVYPILIGGRSALELQGYAHYLPQAQNKIHLYSNRKIPSWLYKLPIKEKFVCHKQSRLWSHEYSFRSPISLNEEIKNGHILKGAVQVFHWGQWNWPIIMSTPERAYLELLDELPLSDTFHMADVIMEGLTNINPKRMQKLLEVIKSVKIKRLFLFFADRHQHQWLPHIKKNKINLGSGKRALTKGGKLDPTYNITVPKDL